MKSILVWLYLMSILVIITMGFLLAVITFNIDDRAESNSVLHVTQLVWTKTIYIREDGSIDPPDAPIENINNTIYRLTASMSNVGDGIIVMRSNIILTSNSQIQMLGTRNYAGITIYAYNVTVKNFKIRGFRYGIKIAKNSSNNHIVNNDISLTYVGILSLSDNNVIVRNHVSDNDYGIVISFGRNNLVKSNNVLNSGHKGIQLGRSYGNYVIGNNVRGGDTGILAVNSYANNILGNKISMATFSGVFIENSSINRIIGNIMESNQIGITLLISYSNVVRENQIIGNEYGVSAYRSINDMVYNNNFRYNDNPLYTDTYVIITWSMEYPVGGNYWDSYTDCRDVKSGPAQNEPGSDGVCDSRYVLPADIDLYIDHYPLSSPIEFNRTPTISIIQPSSGDVFETDDITVLWNIEIGSYDIVSTMLILDGEPINVGDQNNAILNGLDEGNHVLTVKIQDEFGNIAMDTVEFSINNPEPVTTTKTVSLTSTSTVTETTTRTVTRTMTEVDLNTTSSPPGGRDGEYLGSPLITVTAFIAGFAIGAVVIRLINRRR